MSKVPPWSWLCLATAILWHAGPSHQEQRIVCYYTNWSVYRPGTAKFNPQNINPYLCTHLVYAFGGFTKENNFKPFDKYQDIEKGGYAKFTGLKTYNKNLKTMLAVGGWNEGSSRFSPLVASPERRKEFVKNSIKFMRQNHFDGLDLDWEYPSFRDGGKPRDKDNYATLVQELREEYEKESEKTGRPRLLLTMAVPAGIEYINKGYDVPKLMKYLDWMNILSYDYHSAFEPSVNHHSPLFSLEEESEYNYDSDLNINHTINHYLEAGAEESKLVLGIPTYGRSYTLFNSDANEIGAPADGPGEMGDATRENGYLAYYEICEKLKDDGWTVEHPNPKAMGPYAFKDNQWVGYDDESIVRKKAEYVVARKLGGIMFWSIDNDDFRGNCHGKPYPLIEAAKDALMSASEYNKISVDGPVTSAKVKPRPRTRPNRKEEEKTTTTTTTERHRPVRKRLRPKVQRQKEEPSTTTNSPALTQYQTPEPPTTPDPGSDFKCEDEGFFPHPRDCKKYFWCLSSGPSELGIVAHQFTCPSGLYFNKAADSCDYTQNVRCLKPKSTSTTSTSTTTTTTTPPSTTRRTTSKTTTTTTTTTPKHEEYEYEYEYDDETGDKDSEEDPRVIKELITLIRKAGGIEELERQLKIHKNESSSANAGSTTPSGFSKVLYERVLKGATGKTERPRTSNSRGPQFDGPKREDSAPKTRSRPTYTAINRQRSTTEKDSVNDSEQPESGVVRKSNLPEYMTIIRQRSSTTAFPTSQKSEVISERSQMPEYVTIRRFRPTTEEASYTSAPETEPSSKSENDNVNAIATNYDENPETSSRRYAITTEPSSSTTKVSEPVPPKVISKPRPFQKPETTYTNRYNPPPRRTTTTFKPEEPSTKAEEYDDGDKTNQLSRRRGSSRFEYPENYNETQTDQKTYQDRKFRPDIALEIADLSSLTSADFSKTPNTGSGRKRISLRRGQPESENTTIELAPRFQNRNVFVRRTTTESSTEVISPSTGETASTAAFTRRTTTESESGQISPLLRQRSTTPPAILNETTTSKIFNRISRKPFRRVTSEAEPTSTTTEAAKRPSRKVIRRYRPSRTTQPPSGDNSIRDNDIFRNEEEDENIKLSETTIKERSERVNSFQSDKFEGKQLFSRLGKTSHETKGEENTENYSQILRTTKIVRKLDKATEGAPLVTTPHGGRTRKVVRKLGLASSTTFADNYTPVVHGTTTEEVSEETSTYPDEAMQTTTIANEEEITAASVTATDKDRTSESTPSFTNESTPLSTNELNFSSTSESTPSSTDELTPSSTTESNPSSRSESTPLSTTVGSKLPIYIRARYSRPSFLLQRTRGSTEASTTETAAKRAGFRSRYERKRPSPVTKSTTPEVEVTTLSYNSVWEETESETDDNLTTPMETSSEVSTTVDEHSEKTSTVDDVLSTTVGITEPSTTTASYSSETEANVATTTTKRFRKRRPTKSRSALSRNIETSQKNANSYKIEGPKNYKLKLNLNRNVPEPSTTESTAAAATVTLLHVFAETEPPPITTTTTQRQTDKVEKLVEVNRIVEVSENEFARLPIYDRVGAINRVTNIKIVDDASRPIIIEGKSSVSTFTPMPPPFDAESSTIALEGLFQFKSEQANDELLETEHARYVNVKVLPKGEPNDDEYVTSKAEVIEITPKYNAGLIRIAPIEISLSKPKVTK